MMRATTLSSKVILLNQYEPVHIVVKEHLKGVCGGGGGRGGESRSSSVCAMIKNVLVVDLSMGWLSSHKMAEM